MNGLALLRRSMNASNPASVWRANITVAAKRSTMKIRFALAVTAVLFATAPALAQQVPQVPPAVTNIITKIAGDAAAPYGIDPNHVRGHVTYFRRFDLQIRMALDAYRTIRLHQGTVINPRGATIQPGQVLDVVGRAQSDGTLDADTITIIH
jgi:hypothetical protein